MRNPYCFDFLTLREKFDEKEFENGLVDHIQIQLRCYAIIELKATEFKPDYAGKVNFYLTEGDELMKHKDGKTSIRLLLCKTKIKPWLNMPFAI